MMTMTWLKTRISLSCDSRGMKKRTVIVYFLFRTEATGAHDMMNTDLFNGSVKETKYSERSEVNNFQ